MGEEGDIVEQLLADERSREFGASASGVVEGLTVRVVLARHPGDNDAPRGWPKKAGHEWFLSASTESKRPYRAGLLSHGGAARVEWFPTHAQARVAFDAAVAHHKLTEEK